MLSQAEHQSTLTIRSSQCNELNPDASNVSNVVHKISLSVNAIQTNLQPIQSTTYWMQNAQGLQVATMYTLYVLLVAVLRS